MRRLFIYLFGYRERRHCEIIRRETFPGISLFFTSHQAHHTGFLALQEVYWRMISVRCPDKWEPRLNMVFFLSLFIDKSLIQRQHRAREIFHRVRARTLQINRPCKLHQNSHLAAETCSASLTARTCETRAVFLFAALLLISKYCNAAPRANRCRWTWAKTCSCEHQDV